MSFKRRDRFFVVVVVLWLAGVAVAGLIDYKGRSVIETPTGAGGIALKNNEVINADRVGTYVEKSGPPDRNDDGSDTNGNGIAYENSIWKDTSTNQIYRCVDATATAAVWVRIVSSADAPRGGISFLPHPSNPLFGDDEAFISVFKVGTTWHAYGGISSMYHWTSTDGITDWSAATEINNLTANGVASAWYEEGTYYMLYRNSGGTAGISLATSSDGVTWTPNGNNPVLVGGGGWDGTNSNLDPQALIKIGNTYYLHYNTTTNRTTYGRETGVATSTDLVTWNKDGNNPIFSDVDSDEGGWFCPTIWKVGEWYYLAMSRYINAVNKTGGVEFELYADTSPTFYSSTRQFLGVIDTTVNAADWENTSHDTPWVVTDTVQRDTYASTNGQIWMYFEGMRADQTRDTGLLIQAPHTNRLEGPFEGNSHDIRGVAGVRCDTVDIGADGRAALSVMADDVNRCGQLMMKDPSASGNSSVAYMSFWDSTEDGGDNDTGRLGYVGFSSASNSGVSISNSVQNGDINFRYLDAAVAKNMYIDASENRLVLDDTLLALTPGSAMYVWDDRGNHLTLQSQETGQFSGLEFYAFDGDGTDDVTLQFWGVGTPGSITNRERMQLGWDTSESEYFIMVEEDGTGTLRPLNLYTEGNADQLHLAINGSVGIGTPAPSANADLTLEGGVLNLKETTTPSADANYGKVYTKSDNKLYFQDGAGNEHEIALVP